MEIEHSQAAREVINRKWMLLLLALALLGVLVQVTQNRPNWCTSDFPVFYYGGKLAGTPQLYSVVAIRAAHEQATGCAPASSIFVRPPFYAALLWPLGRLPFQAAWIVWIVFSIAALVTYLLLWPGNRILAVLALAWSFPLGYSFSNGQDAPVLMFLLACAAALLLRDRPVAAGLVLALCGIKFHLFLLLPVWIVCAQLWRLAKGFATGVLTLIAFSFVVGPWNWPSLYLAVLSDSRIDPKGPGGPMYFLIHDLASGRNTEIALSICVAIAVVFCVAVVSMRAPALVGLAAAIIGGLLINRHVAPSDLVLLVPAGFAVGRSFEADWARPLIAVLISPFLYLVPSIWWVLALLQISLLSGMAYYYLRLAHGRDARNYAVRGIHPAWKP